MMPLRKKSTTIMMMTENTTMRKPLRSSGTLNAPIYASLSRKRSHHSEQAMYRKEAMQLPGVTYDGVSGHIAFDDTGDAIRDTAYIKTIDAAAGAWTFVTQQKAS